MNIECADETLATSIASDTGMKKIGVLVSGRHLVIKASAESEFRRNLRKLGFILPTGQKE